jgi:hypothetical protein
MDDHVDENGSKKKHQPSVIQTHLCESEAYFFSWRELENVRINNWCL